MRDLIKEIYNLVPIITMKDTKKKDPIKMFVCLFGFYDISTFAGYLMPNTFFF